MSGLTLDQVVERLGEAAGFTLSRGALSAVESGLRGASSELITALELAYGLDPGSIDVNYERRATTHPAVVAR